MNKQYQDEEGNEQLKALVKYIQEVLSQSQCEFIKNELCDFLEFSQFSNESIEKQCYMKRLTGGRYKQGLFRQCIACRRFQRRWLIFNEDGICYCNNPIQDQKVNDMYFFDNRSRVKYGLKRTRVINGIFLTTSVRDLKLKIGSRFQMYDTLYAFTKIFKKNPYLAQENRCEIFYQQCFFKVNTFAPPRVHNNCKYYVDSQQYYSDIYDAISNAKSQIFITDWSYNSIYFIIDQVIVSRNTFKAASQRRLKLSYNFIQILLKKDTRLSYILGEKTKTVEVYVIMYHEAFILPLNSLHSKKTLEFHAENKANMKVLRHPSDIISLWSHHEKMVVIDQEIGFMGGLDLCIGRMDNHEHRLKDYDDESIQFFTGQDYSNPRKKDYFKVEEYKCYLDKKREPRMPWHDLAIQVKGEVVRDMVRHFVLYWNFAQYDLALAKKMPLKNMKKQQEKIDKKDMKKSIFSKMSGFVKEKLFQSQKGEKGKLKPEEQKQNYQELIQINQLGEQKEINLNQVERCETQEINVIQFFFE